MPTCELTWHATATINRRLSYLVTGKDRRAPPKQNLKIDAALKNIGLITIL